MRAIAEMVVGDARDDKSLLLARLTDWVYHNQGFQKNSHYFAIREFGPTATQVLQHGGDCADKSRLLSAILRELGVDSTLVMLYSKNDLKPTHTVVETREDGFFAVADPVFNIVFPDKQGRLLGLRELRKNTDILVGRVRDLGGIRGKNDKVNFYKMATESYEIPKTINWDKNILTRAAFQLVGLWSDDPYLVGRPMFLENPYVLSFVLCAGMAVTTMLVGWGIRGRKDKQPL